MLVSKMPLSRQGTPHRGVVGSFALVKRLRKSRWIVCIPLMTEASLQKVQVADCLMLCSKRKYSRRKIG